MTISFRTILLAGLSCALGLALVAQAESGAATDGTAATENAAPPAPRAKKPKAAKNLPPLLRKVEDKYASSKTLSAKFEQVVQTALSKQKQTSQGTLTFERPNHVRWETLSPDRSLFVSDGVTAWFYTPPFDPDDKTEHGEYHERKASQVQTKLANALLSGSFSIARDMAIHAESDTRFTLTPRGTKKGADPIKRATIEVDPKSALIRKVTVEHRDGNTTEITLSAISLGKSIDPAQFSFTPPPNTDRVDD